MLQALWPEDEAALQTGLAQLVEAELLYQRGRPPRSRYHFKHALIRDAAYASLLKRTRQQMHQRIADCLVETFADITTTQPELVAQHYTEAACHELAVTYWQHAVERARQRQSHAEAIEHCTRGLQVLAELPETPDHIQQEIRLQADLGASLIVVKGFAAPEIKPAYERAQQLCQQLGDTLQLLPILVGLCLHYTVTSRYQTAQSLAEQVLALAECSADRNHLTVAHYLAGTAAFFRGDFQRAQAHTTQGINHYDVQQHAVLTALCNQDPGVGCHLYLAQALQLLGYADQAAEQVQIALRVAQSVEHPFTYAYALVMALRLDWLCQNWDLMEIHADMLLTHADGRGVGSLPNLGLRRKGYALAKQGRLAEGTPLMQAQVGGRGGHHGYVRLESCQIQVLLGQREQALQELEDILAHSEQSGERGVVAECHRLKGELLLHMGLNPEDEFQKALDVARSQQAKWWEIRAATNLARLWQSQDKRQEAYDLLAPVYEWFTEGFDTADLQEAKALLKAL